MLLRYAAEVGNVELLNELPKPAYKDDWKAATVSAARGGKIDNLIWLSSSLEKEEYASEFYSTFWAVQRKSHLGECGPIRTCTRPRVVHGEHTAGVRNDDSMAKSYRQL
jgi:hypothetical protein